MKKVKREPELNAYLSRKNIPEGGVSLKGVGDEDIKKIIISVYLFLPQFT